MTGKEILCYCFGITSEDIKNYFLEHPEKSVEQFIADTAYGTKCTSCLLDLDILLDSINRERGPTQLQRPPGSRLKNRLNRISFIPQRTESAFFLNSDGIKTFVKLANYSPFFEPSEFAVPHKYELVLFTNDGKLIGKKFGRIEAEEDAGIDLSEIANCPPQGWLKLKITPLASGLQGTLRPQIVLLGPHWSLGYHTQLHAHATTRGRRIGVSVRATHGRTNSAVSVINGTRRKLNYSLSLESTQSSFKQTNLFQLNGSGASIIELDSVFPSLPEDGNYFLTVLSDRPTRKHIINRHTDGSLSVDHFPTGA